MFWEVRVEVNSLHVLGTMLASHHGFLFTPWVSAVLLTLYCVMEELFIYSSKEFRITMANFTPIF